MITHINHLHKERNISLTSRNKRTNYITTEAYQIHLKWKVSLTSHQAQVPTILQVKLLLLQLQNFIEQSIELLIDLQQMVRSRPRSDRIYRSERGLQVRPRGVSDAWRNVPFLCKGYSKPYKDHRLGNNAEHCGIVTSKPRRGLVRLVLLITRLHLY